jgi:uncharacterized protein DUF4926
MRAGADYSHSALALDTIARGRHDETERRGAEMTDIKVDEVVRLKQDLPELGLHRGEKGVVCSTWFDPGTAFEVEFQPRAPSCSVRALLMRNQIQKDAQGFVS